MPEHLETVRDALTTSWGRIDGVHSIGFTQSCLGDDFMGVTWDDVAVAMHISAYSYKSLADSVRPADVRRRQAFVGLDFDNTVAWPAYNWMGVAKSALEGINRYLAVELGPKGIRSLKSAGHHPVRSLDSEYRKNSIAHVVVDHAAVSMNDLAHPVIIAVERMNDIVGEQPLGKSGESTDVDKQDGHVFFLAGGLDELVTHALDREFFVLVVQHKSADGHGTGHARLAGQSNHRFELKMGGNFLFRLRSRAAIFQPFEHRRSAGGTSCIAATGMCKLDPGTQCRLKNRLSGRRLDQPGIRQKRYADDRLWFLRAHVCIKIARKPGFSPRRPEVCIQVRMPLGGCGERSDGTGCSEERCMRQPKRTHRKSG